MVKKHCSQSTTSCLEILAMTACLHLEIENYSEMGLAGGLTPVSHFGCGLPSHFTVCSGYFTLYCSLASRSHRLAVSRNAQGYEK